MLLVGGWDELIASIVGLPFELTLVQLVDNVTDFQKKVATRVVECDYGSFDDLRRETAKAFDDGMDLVVSLTEFGLLPAARLAAVHGVPGLGLKAIAATRDKLKMRQLLGHKVAALKPVPFSECSDANDLAAFHSAQGPCIVKPAAGAGSIGVHAVESADAIDRAWQWASAAADGGVVIAEQLLRGSEFSVETVSVQGKHTVLAVTEKTTSGAPNFVELGHVSPPVTIGSETAHALGDAAQDVLRALDYRDGAAHVELMWSAEENSVALIEVNTRVGGDRIWELTHLSTGVNQVAAALQSYMGVPCVEPQQLCAASIAFVQPGLLGRVTQVTGTDRAAAHPGVVRVSMNVGAGSLTRQMASSADRLGYVLAIGPTPELALQRARAACVEIDVVVEDSSNSRQVETA